MRKRVLWISCVAERGGAEVYIVNFLRHLDPARFEASVVFLRPGPLEEQLRAEGIATRVFPGHRMRNLVSVFRSVLAISRIIRQNGIHLVHSNMFRGHAYGGWAARQTGIPEVWSVHSAETWDLEHRIIGRIPSSMVLANCPRTADSFAGRETPVAMIWPPVDIGVLAKQTPRNELAARFDIPPAARWIGQGSRLQRYKGHEFLLRAIAALPADASDVHGIIMGGALFGMEQTYPNDLRRLAADLGISGRIHFTGHLSGGDLHGMISACELMMHPAMDEDFGLIVAESQALGKPVIAFATVGPAAIIEADVTGRLIPIGDQAALNHALLLTLGDAKGLQSMGRAAVDRVRRWFAADIASRRMERVYDALLEKTPLQLDEMGQPMTATG